MRHHPAYGVELFVPLSALAATGAAIGPSRRLSGTVLVAGPDIDWP
jgi:hypothetical protein